MKPRRFRLRMMEDDAMPWLGQYWHNFPRARVGYKVVGFKDRGMVDDARYGRHRSVWLYLEVVPIAEAKANNPQTWITDRRLAR